MFISMFFIFLHLGHNLGCNGLKPSQRHAKLSFLNAALNPQEMAWRYWSYEGFMPIFWFGLIIWMYKVLGF